MEEKKKQKSRGRPKAICRETGDHVHYAPTKPKRPRQTPSRIVKSSFGVTRYGECRKNQAADIGSTAYDGCGEFVSGTGGEDPLNCAACGCHRSFHLSEAPETVLKISSDEFSKIFCSPYGDRKEACVEEEEGRVKRWKTKFTAEQTEKMRNLAEKLKWKVSSERREEADQFCLEMKNSYQQWLESFSVYFQRQRFTVYKEEKISKPNQSYANGGDDYVITKS